MSFIVVTKTVADCRDRKFPIPLPAFYPLECVEFRTAGDAYEKFPTKRIFHVDEYRVWQGLLQEQYAIPKDFKLTKKWWKFWRKA